MANITKTNPVSIDKAIQKVQIGLYDGLGYTNIDGLGRIYKVKRGDNTIPARHISNKDYKEVLLNDKITGSFFFVAGDETDVIGDQAETEVDIIFFLNLQKIKPSFPHRSDEEVNSEIVAILHRYKCFKGNEYKIFKDAKALDGFDTELTEKILGEYLIVRYTGKMKYQFNC